MEEVRGRIRTGTGEEKLEVVELPGVGRNTVARSVIAAFILL